jgi:group I intron endonuclease
MGTVYAIGNRVTKRFYIGSTNCGREYRPKRHLTELRANRHKVEQMQEDYNRYGEESFFVCYLGEFSGDELKRMEIFMMQVMRTKDQRFGYNYKDKTGTSERAVKDRWRSSPKTWRA